MKAPSSFAPLPGAYMPTLSNFVSAAGTNLTGATVIPAGQDLTVVTTCGSGAGVNLPALGVSAGEQYQIANHGANACLVYPGTSGGKMGTASAGAGYSLAAGKTGYFTYIGSAQWTTNP